MNKPPLGRAGVFWYTERSIRILPMPLAYQLTYVVTAFVSAILAAVVFFHRPNDRVVRAFTVLMGALVFWIITLYLYYSTTDGTNVIFIGRLNFSAGSFIAYGALLFAMRFPKEVEGQRRWPSIVGAVTTLLIAVLTFVTDHVIESEHIVGISRQTTLGDMYWLWVAHFLVFVALSIGILWRTYRSADASSRGKIKTFLWGWIVTIVGGTITQIVLPPLTGNTDIQNIGPLFTFALVGTTSYLVVKHELMSVTIIGAETLVLGLLSLFIIQIALATSLVAQIFSAFSMAVAVWVGTLLVREVRQEVRRREELEIVSAKLRTANIELRELDKAKSEFINIASHQLRTPVSVIKGYLALMEEGAYGKLTAKLKEKVRQMFEMNERLVHLINNFLNMSRIEKKRIEFLITPADLGRALTQVVEEMRFEVKDKGLDIVYKDPGELPFVKADIEKVHEVMVNLIDNAVKYSPSDSRITVSASKDAATGFITVLVADTGIGLTEEERDRLFEKYYRAQSKDMPTQQGSGLGLYICRIFMEGMGGRIWVHSTEKGKGTTFAFSLPIDTDDPIHHQRPA
jgi:signal transduction histidine kinase